MEKIKRLISALSENEKWGWIIQFIKFAFVGVMNTLIDLLVQYAFMLAFEFSWEHYPAAVLGFVISVTNAYYWSSRYVFADGRKKTKGEKWREYLKTVASYAGTFLLSLVLTWLFVDIMDINKFVAPVLRLLITVPLNYVINKFWTFRRKSKDIGKK